MMVDGDVSALAPDPGERSRGLIRAERCARSQPAPCDRGSGGGAFFGGDKHVAVHGTGKRRSVPSAEFPCAVRVGRDEREAQGVGTLQPGGSSRVPAGARPKCTRRFFLFLGERLLCLQRK